MSGILSDWPADGRALRHSPLLLWALSPTARAVVGRVLQAIPPTLQEAGLVRRFDPEGDYRPALTEVLADIAQNGRLRDVGAEVEVRLVIGAWEVSDPLDRLLGEVSDLMARVLPGGRTLALALLVPPSLASPAHIARAWDTLQGVARAMGRVPFLGSASVYQVKVDLYRSPESPTGSLLDLSDLLCRSAIDADAGAVVRRLADPLIRNRRHCDGEPAGYFSLAACQLRYDQAELIRYVHARFQQELLALGLCNPEAVSPQRQLELRAQIGGLVGDLKEMLLRQVGGLGRWETRAGVDADGMVDPLALRKALTQAVQARAVLAQSGLTDLGGKVEARLQADLDGLLDRAPDYLAGAVLFLGTLGWAPTPGDDSAGGPQGIASLEQAFCRDPLRQSAASLFKSWFREALARFEAPPAPESPDPQESCEGAAKLLEVVTQGQDGVLGAPGRLLISAWRAVQDALEAPVLTADHAHGLIAGAVAGFLAEAGSVSARLAALEQDRDGLREEMRALRTAYPVYKFWLWGAYAEGKQRLQDEVEQLAEEREATLAAFGAAGKVFTDLANDLLWPHYRRAAMMDAVRQSYDAVRGEFDRYLDTLRGTWGAEWAEARKLQVVERPSLVTVNSAEKGDLLYRHILGTPDWPELVAAALAYIPSLIERERGEPPDYAACKTLGDHFHADADLLIRRVSDFGANLVKPAWPLDILDIVELPGKEDAWRFLSGIDAALSAEPELVSARMPRLLELGLYQRQCSIRCTPGIQERLRRDYPSLFAGQDQFIDSRDPCRLDVTRFTFGFPASALHALASVAPVLPVALSPGKGVNEIVLEARRAGASHTVTVTLEGKDDRRIQRVLVVDTGASCLSLPASLIPQLGLAAETLRTAELQTANGSMEGAIGTLPAVWLNDQRVPEVAVAFIEDERLGGEGLLGMSVLSRFRLTIDDEQGRMVLAKL